MSGALIIRMLLFRYYVRVPFFWQLPNRVRIGNRVAEWLQGSGFRDCCSWEVQILQVRSWAPSCTMHFQAVKEERFGVFRV